MGKVCALPHRIPSTLINILYVFPSVRFLPLIRDRVAGATALAGEPRQPSPRPLPPAPPGGSRGVPRTTQRCNPSSVSWVGPPRGLLHPNQMLNHLNWLLWTWRSSGSTLSSSRMSELLTLSLRLSPDTLRRKLISDACIHHLILSVITQSS